MTCMIDDNLINKTIDFHGHTCPGLAIGIRVSELAMEQLDMTDAASTLCVVETDMCGVDAIQFLTGCTFGKGNLVHKDFGKSGFTFFNRKQNRGFRAVFTHESRDSEDRDSRIKSIMEADLKNLFTIKKITDPPVKPARILQSIECSECREKVMESRIRRFDNKYLCIPCFINQEQKI